MFEPASLYFRTSGAESDICNKELYEVRRYRDEFQDLVLRPEGTASCVREIIDNNLLIENKEVKFYYIGEMFRYNRPQKGRYRQHVQLGCEIFGNDSVYLDYELIEIATSLLNKLNIDYVLEVNFIGNSEDRNVYRKVLKKYFEDNDISCDKDPLKILDKLSTYGNAPCIQLNEFSQKRFEELKALLNQNNIKFRHNPYLVRGLDYYNDLVFEIKADNMSVIAGGRYNALSQQINEKFKIPALGFGAGVERLMMFSENLEEDQEKIAIIDLDDSNYTLKIAQKLRDENYICSVYWGYSLTKALNFLSKKYRYIVFAGKDEVINQTFILKDLLERVQGAMKLNEKFEIKK